jgi:Tol biopolymer transport system component
VAFESFADNMSTEDEDSFYNIFVRDLQADTTTYVSRAATPADGDSFRPSISGDGRYVAFDSFADSLSADDLDGVGAGDIFVRDLQTNTTVLASRATGSPGDAADSQSANPAISADGHHVAFMSFGKNLGDNDADWDADIFVRNLQTNTTTYVSRASGATGPAGDAVSNNPSISADGRYVAFMSAASNLSDDDADGVTDIFVRDVQANTTTYVSRASGAGNGNSSDPSISADGRFVAFLSEADNLGGDTLGVSDVYVRDLQTGTTTHVGPAQAGGSFRPAISADGGYTAFASSDDDVSPDDDNGVTNVFVHGQFESEAPPPGGDTTPPQTSITYGPSGEITDDTPTFVFSSSESRSTFQCRIDGGAFSRCSPPYTTSPLSGGAHTFEVSAVDRAGNIDRTPARRAFTVAEIAPEPHTASQLEAGVVEKLDVTGAWVGTVFDNRAVWNQLGRSRRRMRLAVPWDIGLPPEEIPSGKKRTAFEEERREFVDWVQKAATAKVEPFVTFWYSVARNCTEKKGRRSVCRTPTMKRFRRAVAAFRASWPQIKILSGWNEPNFFKRDDIDRRDRKVVTPDRKHVFSNANCRGRKNPNSCGPKAAAGYYKIVRRACRGCTVVAGEFTSKNTKTSRAYWRAYLHYLGRSVPKVWAIHPYQDVRDYEHGDRGAKVTKRFATWIRRISHGKAKVWLTAVGAYYRNGGKTFGAVRQCNGVAFINRLARVRRGITRIYYYNFRRLNGAKQDSGLFDPATGAARLAFGRFATGGRTRCKKPPAGGSPS